MAPEPAHTTRGRPVTPFRTRSRSAKFIMRTTKRVVAHNRVTCMMTKTGRIELMSSRLPAPRTSSESPGVGTVETQYTTVAIPDDLFIWLQMGVSITSLSLTKPTGSSIRPATMRSIPVMRLLVMPMQPDFTPV